MGIGNELRGDDAVGVLAVRRLAELLAAAAPDWLLLVEAGPAPENFTGVLRRFAPDVVVLVDAASLGQPAGTIAWLDWQETSGLSASTHTMPPYMLARYLVHELGCQLAMLGIEPAELEFEAPLSPSGAAAVEAVAHGIAVVVGDELA